MISRNSEKSAHKCTIEGGTVGLYELILIHPCNHSIVFINGCFLYFVWFLVGFKTHYTQLNSLFIPSVWLHLFSVCWLFHMQVYFCSRHSLVNYGMDCYQNSLLLLHPLYSVFSKINNANKKIKLFRKLYNWGAIQKTEQRRNMHKTKSHLQSLNYFTIVNKTKSNWPFLYRWLFPLIHFSGSFYVYDSFVVFVVVIGLVCGFSLISDSLFDYISHWTKSNSLYTRMCIQQLI